MKKLVALLLAVAMLLSFAACGGSEEPTTPDAEVTDVDGNVLSDDETIADEVTEADVDATADPNATTDPDATTDPNAPTAAPAAAPTTTAEIIAYYNTTVNNAVAARVGFNKVRYTDNEKLNAGFLLKTFGDLLYQFMGIGAENKYTMDVTKGKWESDLPHQYLRKSTLSEADVTKATCTVNGDLYTITMNVKNGSSSASKSAKANNSPIDKCGICVGDADKSYFDHKTAIVIYDAIDDVLGGAKISESYNNATVKAVINATTGQLVSLTIEYNISVVIDAAGGGNATGTTHILYKNFKY